MNPVPQRQLSLRYQLLILLTRSQPLVWRRVLVPTTIKLSTLHRVIQAAMGWTNSHLHQFIANNQYYSDPRFDLEKTENSQRTALETLIPQQGYGCPWTMEYEYDFGDRWRHMVIVESIEYVAPTMAKAICLDGANACPPEDCGGLPGYADLVRVLGDPSHADYEEMREWAGRDFDPFACDRAAINRQLARIK